MIAEPQTRLPDALIEAFQKEPLPVLFVGSGLGREARPRLPTAEELAGKVCEKLKLVRGSETLPELLQYLKNDFSGSNADLIAWIRRTLNGAVAKPSPTHRLLLRLPVREIVTTNWDDLLEVAALQVPDRKPTPIDDAHQWRDGSDGELLIARIHGHLGGRKLVATTDDYFEHYRRSGRLWLRQLSKVFRERVVIFLGYSFHDFDTWTSYMATRLKFGDRVHGHFMIDPTAGSHVVTYWRNYGVSHVAMTAREFAVASHRELGTFYKDNDVAEDAVAAAIRGERDDAHSRIEAIMAANGWEDSFQAAEFVVNEDWI